MTSLFIPSTLHGSPCCVCVCRHSYLYLLRVSVPLALVFLQSGLSPGATLVFLIMGPPPTWLPLPPCSTSLEKNNPRIPTHAACRSLTSGMLLHQFSSHITFDEVSRENYLHRIEHPHTLIISPLSCTGMGMD